MKLSGNQRTYFYSGGSGLSVDFHFVDLELSYDVLSLLLIVLSKHFNHPHPYIEIAISISQWWNAGMGNTDTLHPVSVLFPSLNLKYFRIRFLLLVYLQFHPTHAVVFTLVTEKMHACTRLCAPGNYKH